jgi:hypothetical protein
MYFVRSEDLFGLQHKPLRPPRKETIGEMVFSSMWETLMQREDGFDSTYQIEHILSSYPSIIEQRQATVLASVVCWLGTNCGRSFLQQASTVAEMIKARCGEQYLVTWAIENSRQGFINHGVRTLESCLSSGIVSGRWVIPDLTADDYEVAEHLMRWLGSRDGQDFITNCEQEIERLHRVQREKSLAEWKRRQEASAA